MNSPRGFRRHLNILYLHMKKDSKQALVNESSKHIWLSVLSKLVFFSSFFFFFWHMCVEARNQQRFLLILIVYELKHTPHATAASCTFRRPIFVSYFHIPGHHMLFGGVHDYAKHRTPLHVRWVSSFCYPATAAGLGGACL